MCLNFYSSLLSFILYPLGHFGLTPLTFLFTLPFMQVIVFFVEIGVEAMTVPVSTTVAVVEMGARVAVPA
jgi:hypothetical protein